jgi:hypothetical protein
MLRLPAPTLPMHDHRTGGPRKSNTIAIIIINYFQYNNTEIVAQ